MTFTKSPYGPIAKTTPTDVQQPNSPSQQAAKNRVKRVAAFWKGLTAAQRLAWTAATLDDRWISADAKKSYRPTGYNLYSSCANVWLNAHGDAGTPPSNPPVGELIEPTLSVVATASGSEVNFHGSGDTPAGFTVQFELQALKSASRKPSKIGYRVVGFAPFTAGDGDDVTFTVRPGAYAARYAFVELSTGRRTGFVKIPVSGLALAVEQGGAAEKPAAKRKAA